MIKKAKQNKTSKKNYKSLKLTFHNRGTAMGKSVQLN